MEVNNPYVVLMLFAAFLFGLLAALKYFFCSLLHYSKNGWDFSQEYGANFHYSDVPDGDNTMPESKKLFVALPIIIFLFSVFAIVTGLVAIEQWTKP